MSKTITTSKTVPAWILLTVSFFEGGAVMAVELLGAKIIAPFYGTSLYVWASVLTVTLAGLTAGYYTGGYIASKSANTVKSLLIVLTVGIIAIMLMPFSAPGIMNSMSGYDIRTASLVSAMLFLMPPLVCMGIVSPLIINLINQNNNSAGKTAGTVYAISTMGGILFTLLLGFYMLPQLGIRNSLYIVSFIMFANTLLLLSSSYKQLKMTQTMVIVLIPLVASVFFYKKMPDKGGNISIVKRFEGIMGQWVVADFVAKNGVEYRRLLLNGIVQTYCEKSKVPFSQWFYPHLIAAAASIHPPGSKALLCGLGGGSMAHEFTNTLGFDTDVVEIDERLYDISRRYFGYEHPKEKMFFDDARNYINKCNKNYDVVVFDIVNGEVQPSHLFSIEFFKKIHNMLNTNGMFIVNFQGKYDSMGAKSVLKTLNMAGFKTNVLNNEDQDLLIYANKNQSVNLAQQFENVRYNQLLPGINITRDKLLSSDLKVDYSDGYFLTDNTPRLEAENAEIILEWRKNMINNYAKSVINNGIGLSY